MKEIVKTPLKSSIIELSKVKYGKNKVFCQEGDLNLSRYIMAFANTDPSVVKMKVNLNQTPRSRIKHHEYIEEMDPTHELLIVIAIPIIAIMIKGELALRECEGRKIITSRT